MVYGGELTDSPSPVMTFEVGGSWLAVRVEQVERVAIASRLWPVPLSRPEHMGLYDSGGELVPVLCLEGQPAASCELTATERMLAILHVRGEAVGVAIDRAGRVYDRYRIEETSAAAPAALAAAGAKRAVSNDLRFWLVDADRLFDYESPVAVTSKV
jgi:chemotaxis signal transduction protein